MTEHEAKLRDELEAVEARIKALEVGRCGNAAKVLSQLQGQLNRYPGAISEDARVNLDELAEYMLTREKMLIARAEEIEEQLWDLEHPGNQTQSEMNADANASMDRQR